ncbi:MAG: hypothetical protein ACJAY5_001402 [Actinomycetes bacterium]|jgi:hypothetical protein
MAPSGSGFCLAKAESAGIGANLSLTAGIISRRDVGKSVRDNSGYSAYHSRADWYADGLV